MCDYRPGQLILAHDKSDDAGQRLVEAIRRGQVEHVTLIEGLAERLEKHDITPTLPLKVFLLGVPEGQELWKVNYLHSYYRQLSLVPTHMLAVVPNSYLTLDGYAPSLDHPAYKAVLGSLHGATGKGVTVAIVDSGIEAASVATVARVTDLIAKGGTGDDRVGHGTAIASVIRDVASDARVEVVKITDGPKVVEWDALAGLETASSADVINVSLGFGSIDRTCPACGRQPISTRSMVYEMVVGLALRKPHEPILVAAAGNQSTSSLRYPARFSDVVAVGAVDAAGDRASYSNYGAQNAAGTAHSNLFFAPGGEPTRPVGSTTPPLPKTLQHGTSLATAYASGVIACARERGSARAGLLTNLRAAAKKLRNHSAADDGNGLVQGC